MTTENSSERPERPEKAGQRVEGILPLGPEQKRAYRVNEFCAAYGLSRTTTYALIGAGKLRSFVVGGRRLIHKDDAEALFSEAAMTGAANHGDEQNDGVAHNQRHQRQDSGGGRDDDHDHGGRPMPHESATAAWRGSDEVQSKRT